MGKMTEDGKFEGTTGHIESGLLLQGEARQSALNKIRVFTKRAVAADLLKATIKGMEDPAKANATIYQQVMIAEAVRVAYQEGFVKNMPPEVYADVKEMMDEAKAQGALIGQEMADDFSKFTG